MRVAVLICAIIGGVFGMGMGLVAMAVGGIGNVAEEGSGNSLVGLGISAIVAAIVGLVCGVLHYGGKARTLMAALLVVATLWHVVSISFFSIPGAIFLGLAALFGFLARKPALPRFSPMMMPAGVQGFAMPLMPPAAGAVTCGRCGRLGQEPGKFCVGCGLAL